MYKFLTLPYFVNTNTLRTYDRKQMYINRFAIRPKFKVIYYILKKLYAKLHFNINHVGITPIIIHHDKIFTLLRHKPTPIVPLHYFIKKTVKNLI